MKTIEITGLQRIGSGNACNAYRLNKRWVLKSYPSRSLEHVQGICRSHKKFAKMGFANPSCHVVECLKNGRSFGYGYLNRFARILRQNKHLPDRFTKPYDGAREFLDRCDAARKWGFDTHLANLAIYKNSVVMIDVDCDAGAICSA